MIVSSKCVLEWLFGEDEQAKKKKKKKKKQQHGARRRKRRVVRSSDEECTGTTTTDDDEDDRVNETKTPSTTTAAMLLTRRKEMAEVEGVFKKFDSDSDGFLKTLEAFEALEYGGWLDKRYTENEDDWLHPSRILSLNDDSLSLIDFRDLKRAQRRLHVHCLPDIDEASNKEQIVIFQSLDAERDGIISGADLFRRLRRYYRFSVSKRMQVMLEDFEESRFNNEKFCFNREEYFEIIRTWPRNGVVSVCRKIHARYTGRGRFQKVPVAVLADPPPYLGQLAILSEYRRIRTDITFDYDRLNAIWTAQQNSIALRQHRFNRQKKRANALRDLRRDPTFASSPKVRESVATFSTTNNNNNDLILPFASTPTTPAERDKTRNIPVVRMIDMGDPTANPITGVSPSRMRPTSSGSAIRGF